MDDRLPPTDLNKLRDEILRKPAAAALPRNLSDYWLNLIARDLTDVIEATPPHELASGIALVLHLLQEIAPEELLLVTAEGMYPYLAAYRLEIALELVNRSRFIEAEAATLDTIFKHRILISG